MNWKSILMESSTVSAAPGSDVAAGSVYLGRPWRDYARVTFQNSQLSSIINSAGWSVWQAKQPQTDHVVWREFGNSGAGAKGTRKFGKQASAAVSMSSVIGSGKFIDSSYLSAKKTTTKATKAAQKKPKPSEFRS
jgi:pectinesterase